MLDMLDVLPLPIVGVRFYIKKIVPDSVKPLADSVVVHLLLNIHTDTPSETKSHTKGKS